MRTVDPDQRKPWWLHILAITLGALVYICVGRFGYGWAESIGAAGAALIFTAIMYYRRVGNQDRFWIAVTLLALLQIPLIVTIRPLVEHFRFPFIVVFAVADCLFVAFGISRVCSTK